MAVEILENTLLKLLVRRGTDTDRRQITLASGELGYTTDTERLYIGNASDKGGVVVGNKWQGSNADLTSLAPAVTGDYAYESDTREFKVLTSGTGSAAANWTTVSQNITAANNTIDITSGKIKVATFTGGGGLSANNISPTALGDSIVLDGANKLSLSANINIDEITKRSSDSSYLTLPSTLKINTIEYNFPSNTPSNNAFLGSDGNNNLKWSFPNVIESTVAPTTATFIPVGSIIPFISAGGGVTPPYGWLYCDGTSLLGSDYRDLSSVLGNTLGGNTSVFNLPDFTNKLLYGAADPVTNSLYPMASGVGLSASPLSATGTHYIIKAVGGLAIPTLTVNKNLSAFVNNIDKTGTSFDPLSGNIIIERTPPGQQIFESGSNNKFIMPAGIHFVKFYVTGSGGTAGGNSGGAAATAIGYLSSGPGTAFTVKVGSAPAQSSSTNGDSSVISLSAGTAIVTAGGGKGNSDDEDGTADATIVTGNAAVLNGYTIKGGHGGAARTGRTVYGSGAASYWGNVPAPGAGQGALDFKPTGMFPVNGIVIFEWT
jgi:hypothetical protein